MRKSVEDRFWDKAIPEPNSGCWLWNGAYKSNGYGAFGVERKTLTASRFAYELSVGPVPKGLNVLHRCDNPACVNPDHLYVGTLSQNLQDAYDRGRRSHVGERSPRAKLTEALVLEIRASKKSDMTWARELGLSKPTIQHARVGINWSHI